MTKWVNKLNNSGQILDPSQFSSYLTGFNCLIRKFRYLQDDIIIWLLKATTFINFVKIYELYTYHDRIQSDITETLVTEIKLTEIKDHEINCSLLFNEMKIKSGLVFSRATGRLIGFTEIGDINDETLEFERKFSGKERDLATHILAFMARGIFSHFNFPTGSFCFKGFNSDQLFPCVWEAIGVLESIGLKVRACICDGATPNRKIFKLHAMENSKNISNDGVVYWAVKLFDFQRKMYFISDPPHLIKTLRNNIENSHGHNNTRNLMVSYSGLVLVLLTILFIF